MLYHKTGLSKEAIKQWYMYSCYFVGGFGFVSCVLLCVGGW